MRWRTSLARAPRHARREHNAKQRHHDHYGGFAVDAHKVSRNSSVATAPPPRTVAKAHISTPPPRERPRGGEPQPAAGRALPSRAATVEALEHLLLLAGREPGTPVAHLDPSRRRSRSHLAPRRRVAHARSPRAHRARGRGRLREHATVGGCPSSLTTSSMPSARAAAPPAVEPRDAPRRAGRPPRGGGPVFGTAEKQQLLDDRREPVDLGGAGVELEPSLGRSPPRARASPMRSRSAVSGVRSWWEASATNSRWAMSMPLHATGHLVERAASERCSELPSTGRARGEVAARDPLRGVLQTAQRQRDLARDQTAREQPEQQHSPGHERELGDRAVDRVLHGRHALGDAHRPDRAAAGRTTGQRSQGCSRPACGSCAGSARRCRATRRRSRGGCA